MAEPGGSKAAKADGQKTERLSADKHDIERTPIVYRVARVFDEFLKIDKAEVSHPRFDGRRQRVIRYSMERGDSVAVLLVDRRQRKVWLVEQFRYPTLGKGSGWVEEVPAGMPEDHETFDEAARREVAEETAFESLELEHISTFFVSPGGTSERLALFCAFVSEDQRTSEPPPLDPEEDVRLFAVDLDEFMRNATLGHIDDAKTLIAGLWLVAHRQRYGI